MKIFAIGDLHLSFSTPEKTMELFGEAWSHYPFPLELNWKENVKEGDLVLIPGDISWAKRLEEALVDLAWIDRLPGTKVLIKGNHDYWWPSLTKLQALPFPSLRYIQGNALEIDGVTLGGTRLWDTSEYFFPHENKDKGLKDHLASQEDRNLEEQEKIFQRELIRLETSLKAMKPGKIKIGLTHYPPIGSDLACSRASTLLTKYKLDHVVFGHLHSFQPGSLPFGKADGVSYHLTSYDYLGAKLLQIAEL